MSGRAAVGTPDDLRRMQIGVRHWVERTAKRSEKGIQAASPTILLSALCASAFCPLLLVGGVAGAGLAVISSVGGGMLTEVISDALSRMRKRSTEDTTSHDSLEKVVGEQIEKALAAQDGRSDALRRDIAQALKEIDAGGTALRAAMDQSDDRVRAEVIAAIGALGSGFDEMRFLIGDVAQAAAEIQRSLDVQGADVRVIIEQNNRQATDIRLVREDIAQLATRAGLGRQATTARSGASARWIRGCPYRGLLPFGESEALVFYGRERLVAELAVTLAGRMRQGGLTIVSGASGAGKTSLLRAGLLPALARGRQIPGSDRWRRVVMTPGQDPLAELAAGLAALSGHDPVAVRDGLARNPGQAHLAVWQALAAAARSDAPAQPPDGSADRVIVIVDQFEQVFTLNPGPGGEAGRQAFIRALHAAATVPVGDGQQPPALVLIAVRGDFWDRCAAYPELREVLQTGQFVVGPMSESELRVAITGPAEASGLSISAALVDTILGDLRAAGGDRAAGVLPLLSQAMALTWEKREGDRLTSRGYEQAGGISRAVQTGADRAYDSLAPPGQELARDLLRRMTVATRDGRLTRRPLARSELYSAFPPAERARVDAVLEAFAAERLIVLDENSAQISHDVLLQAWPRLRAWLEEDQASWILFGELADAADAWHDNGGDASFLYRGTHLAALRQAADRWSANPARYPALTDNQRDFLRASEQAAARSSRQRRTAVAALAVLAVVASIASGLAFQQRNTALSQRNHAIDSKVSAEALQAGASNVSLAAQLTVAADHLRPSPALASRLFSTENTPLPTRVVRQAGTNFWAVAYSTDGRTLATGDSHGLLRLWNVADPTRPRPIGKSLLPRSQFEIFSLAFSPDGHLLATGQYGSVTFLWNVTDPARPVPFSRPLISSTRLAVNSVAFSPDSHVLATGDAGGRIRLWDVTEPARPRLLGPSVGEGTSPVESVAFSPDGRTLAAGSDDGKVRLWDVTDPASPRLLGLPLTAGTGVVQSVAFSPGGSTLASGNLDGTVGLWDVSDPASPRQLGQPLTGTAAVHAVAFSADGLTLASGDYNGMIRLWGVAQPARPQPLGPPVPGGDASVFALAFSPDGHTLACGDTGAVLLWNLPRTTLNVGRVPVLSVALGRHTLASADGAIRLWDVSEPGRPRPLGKPIAPASLVDTVTFSRDGRILASGSTGGLVGLWNVADPARPQPFGLFLTDGTAPIDSLAFSPDGRTLAAGSEDGRIRLWNIADPARPRSLGPPLRGGAGIVFTVAFSPDGHTLASADKDGKLRLWNISNAGRARPLGPQVVKSAFSMVSVAFSPQGHTLAGVDGEGTIRLWNIADPSRPRLIGRPLTSGCSAAQSAAFSPDGHILACADFGATIRLWDVTDPAHPRPLGPPLTGGTAAIFSVAFSADGKALATGDYGGTVRVWNLNVSYAVGRICAIAGNLTHPQWHKYVSELPYQPLCAHHGP